MRSYFNFLFVTLKSDETEKIKTEIERNRLYRVHYVETAQEAIECIQRGGVHSLVFNFGALTSERMKLVSNFRDIGFTAPMILFTGAVEKSALDEIQKRHSKTVMIEKPFESKDVWGICQKLLQGQRVNQRVFRRYYTNQFAAVEKSNTGEKIDGHIFNLSRGGAYFECDRGRVRPGDMVRVNIPLDKLQRQYHVDAEVVWYSPATGARVKAAAGLRFVNSSAVYRDLLSRL